MGGESRCLRFRTAVEACEEAEAWYGTGAAAAEASRAMETGDTVRMTAALVVSDRTDPGVRLRAVVHAMVQKRWRVARAAACGLDDEQPLHAALKGALDEIAAREPVAPDLAALTLSDAV